jgi:hypothetical protein
MQCAEFEAVTTDALDGLLSGPALEVFRAHRAACPTCGALYAASEAGLRWLKALDQVEPSPKLVRSVLQATTGIPEMEAARQSWKARLLEYVAPVFATVRQPRFAMSFGMAFFSLTMVLNVAGWKLSDLRHLDLRPSALVRVYHEAEGKLVRYYENIRFVYEVESRVRELKEAATAEQAPRPKENEKKKPKDKPSGESEQPREPRFSRDDEGGIVRAATAKARGSAGRRKV